ncbi:putative mitochondrial protein [Andalucia godoyi]|uniref:Putative mitochondrial protein n=1 Tax=Andalucia godoyi TaxID=505711 RepID=A0A8K0F0K3_ANDGO|nr:putative mitochondrial protein [Andalucia godoyi]|eukprot:ANDGO_08792.mRNA.1 putative mitochondrial protein
MSGRTRHILMHIIYSLHGRPIRDSNSPALGIPGGFRHKNGASLDSQTSSCAPVFGCWWTRNVKVIQGHFQQPQQFARCALHVDWFGIPEPLLDDSCEGAHPM